MSLDNYLNNDTRKMKGMDIAEKKTILENTDGSFSVPSQTVEEIAYLVRVINGKYICNCLDFKERHEQVGICKHIHAVKFWIASQVELRQQAKPKIFADDAIQCVKCGSIRVIKYGTHNGKQAYLCKDCLHRFRESNILKRARYSPEMVSLTLDLYFDGMSLRKIARKVNEQFETNLGAASIYRWMQKFIPKISEYVNSLTPQLSEIWHFDELFVKMKNGVEVKNRGKVAFVWNAMDRKTRFLIASKLTAERDRVGASRVFEEAFRNAHGSMPEMITTDSLPSYKLGLDIALDGVAQRPKLVTNVGIKNGKIRSPNNNRIERLNGTLRERVKVQRGWKTHSTPLAEGMRIHYNFVKPHQALEGQTPAQRAGINVLTSKNKWLELLLNGISMSTTQK